VGRSVRRVPEVAEDVEVIGHGDVDDPAPGPWESVGTMPSFAAGDGIAR
jgi:hypothetical protein